MFRYLALIWRAREPEQNAAAQLLVRRLLARASSWKEALDREGLRVFSADARTGAMAPQLLNDQCGVVLGTVFARNADIDDDTPSRPAALDARQTEAIVASHGRWLTSQAWGNYVAFICARHADTTWILKDPTGSLPCFITVFQGVHVFFSCIADLAQLDIMSYSVNRSYLRMRVVGSGATLTVNPLDEVSQVHRGECVELDPRQRPTLLRRQYYWTPLDFSGSRDVIECPDLAARAMRATVRSCTHSWAGCHASALHRLSGGLDSSIIAGCLRETPARPRITCYTYHDPGGRSDERPWARIAAHSTRCELLECAFSPAQVDFVSTLRMAASVEPTPVMSYVQRNSLERRIAADRQASAVFCGDGGDSGFCSDSLAHVVPEYLRRRGLRAQAIRLAEQVALCVDRSMWTVLWRALHEYFAGHEVSGYQRAISLGSQLVDRDVHEALNVEAHHRHPWFHEHARTPWAVMRRLGALLCTPEYYNALAPDDCLPEVISPLYSQPAIELFLRIPIYRHFEGRDRGLARRAFAQEVPAPILRRSWKDRAPGFHGEIVRRNRPLLRELLLDGALVNEGLLDRKAVEAALSPSPFKSTVLPGEILKHLDVELWARRWLRDTQRRAVA